MNHKNRGMFLEKIINNTIEFYYQNDIAIFHKKNLDISFKAVQKDLTLNDAFVLKKSTVDYYGIYKGIFVAFEAKSTNENVLNLKQIPEHQINYLHKIRKHFGCAFFIIFFKQLEKFYILSVDKIDFSKKWISAHFLEKEGIEITLTYPGIIDFITYIDQMV
ncbi:Holliday junction resolvase RecU [Mesomycoplasma ovipneumoniae]|uniref:Holliday junction resolvase RecU n=1 Tax=Mesomycoplasma ovipneumoniae TaxID=29562 RepID=UPI0028AA2089|nr:Holliday junction resolvase RecU [Mesomycoplasma ovipneumoniae]WNM13409.1 Holliday junction resolvase RecU [Mesomycoplasma ovipneumoniae]